MIDYTRFQGKIVFRRTIEPEEVLDALDRFCYDADIIENRPNKQCFTLSFGGSCCYEPDRDIFERIIDDLTEHICSGSIRFVCDDEVYRYYFNPIQQRWTDQKGMPVSKDNRIIIEDWDDEEDEEL